MWRDENLHTIFYSQEIEEQISTLVLVCEAAEAGIGEVTNAIYAS